MYRQTAELGGVLKSDDMPAPLGRGCFERVSCRRNVSASGGEEVEVLRRPVGQSLGVQGGAAREQEAAGRRK